MTRLRNHSQAIAHPQAYSPMMEAIWCLYLLIWGLDIRMALQHTGRLRIRLSGILLQLRSWTALRDSKGNSITCNGASCTDTVGRTINFTRAADQFGNPYVTGITYLDSNGQSQTIQLIYQTDTFNYIYPPAAAATGIYFTDVPEFDYQHIKQIIYPNGTSYNFSYVLNSDGTTTGELSKLTLPAGGYVRYEYSWFDNDDVFGYYAASARVVSARYLSSDGTAASEQAYHYDFSARPDCSVGTTSASVLAPDMSTTTYTFLQEVTTSTGTTIKDASGNILQSTNDTVEASAAVNNGTYSTGYRSCGGNNPHTKTSTLTRDDGSTLVTTYNYDQYNNPISITKTGAGVTQNQSLSYLADVNTAYAAPTVSILKPVKQEDDYGSLGNHATTVFAYDENNGSPQGLFGNLTSVSRWDNGVSAYYKKQTIYNAGGAPSSTIDEDGNTTSYSYDPTGVFLSKIAYPSTAGMSHSEYFVYDPDLGVLLQHIDQNGTGVGDLKHTTFYNYDSIGRVLGITYPDGGSVTTCYVDKTGDVCPQGSILNSANKTVASSPDPPVTTVRVSDGFGRPVESILLSDPHGADYTVSTYDGLGRLASISNPYRATGDPTYGITSFTYDGLGRKILECQPDNGTAVNACAPGASYLQWKYTGTSVLATDEVGNQTQYSDDQFGRVVGVTEPGGQITEYGYDSLGNLTSVNQQGISGDVAHNRSFGYDSLSRLITSLNPEQGSICYGKLNSGVCGGGYDPNGNLLYKTDARGVLTSFTYDALNRIMSKSFSSDPSSTSSSCYQYDSSILVSQPANLIGRIANEWTQRGNCVASLPSSGVLTQRSVLSYDSMGRMKQSQQCVLSNCTSGIPFKVAQNYDFAGNMVGYTNGVEQMMLTQAFDGAGRLNTVTSSWSDTHHPPTLFTVQSTGTAACSGQVQGYSAGGQLQLWTLGNDLNILRCYDKRLRITSESATQP